MNENELQQQIEDIRKNVETINRRVGGNGTVLWRGIVSGFGYLVGTFVAIIIIGFVLNIVGIIPAFKNQVKSLQNSLEQTQNRQFPGTK